MSSKLLLGFLSLAAVAGVGTLAGWRVEAGQTGAGSEYKALAPIRQGNLTIFPIVAAASHDTEQFLTLDEGLRSGEVEVTEAGRISPLIRRRPPQAMPGIWQENPRDGSRGAEVNKLVLVNNAKRPLLLLAGEVVTGGKQDRVIGKDRLVPAESDPIDLSVFCVEPGRWVGATGKFGPMNSAMAAPAVRGSAMGYADQNRVWSEVRKAQAAVVARAPAPVARELASTSSYAGVMENKEVLKQIDSVAAPMDNSYRSLIKELKERNAVGVVVAVNGQIIWADIFASTQLLQKYWPKLVRSYAAEAITAATKRNEVSEKSAQAFLENLDGRRQTIENEPGLYRHTEVSGDNFKAFALTSLLPKTGFDLHIAKMAD